MLAASGALRVCFGPAFEDEVGFERNRTKVVDGDVAGHRHDIAMAIGLAHGFIEQCGDDASVHVAGWPLKLPSEINTAEDALVFVNEELELKAGRVVLAAAKAAVQGAMRQRNFA